MGLENKCDSNPFFSEYGKNIYQIINEETDFQIEEFANSWADEPGAFNSLCYLHRLK